MDVHGASSLLLAIDKGDEKICGVLVQAGARLDVKFHRDVTPLIYAQRFHPDNAALLALLAGAGGPAPGTVCDHCGKTMDDAGVTAFKACGDCHNARYCNATCSAVAWPRHKKACREKKAEREKLTKAVFLPPLYQIR